VDLNAAHLATLELKRAALRHLPDYDAVLAFLADAARADNIERYRSHVAPHLPPAARAWWDGRDVLGRPRHAYFTRHFYRRGLLGGFIGLAHPFVRLLGGDLARLAEARDPAEQRALFARHVAPVFRHWLVRCLANRPAALYSLGIPPAQFEAIRRDAEGGMAADFCRRMERLLCATGRSGKTASPCRRCCAATTRRSSPPCPCTCSAGTTRPSGRGSMPCTATT
jgi:S-adenosylmethionine-diacylglycerol 3-amino-3-carboxypropyl transferase